MSKMGSFVYDVQETVCENYTKSFDEIKAIIKSQFGCYSEYAIEVAEEEYNDIRDEMEEYYSAEADRFTNYLQTRECGVKY
jgi:hypothetical protein